MTIPTRLAASASPPLNPVASALPLNSVASAFRRKIWVLAFVVLFLPPKGGSYRNLSGAGPLFVESAAATGLTFTHVNGATGQYYMAEQMGAGVALFDYDNDGDLDVFLVQGGPAFAEATAGRPLTRTAGPSSRLFRNDLTVGRDGKRTLHFTDVTDKAGVGLRTYGMGAATGDYDNDGFLDLFLTGFGAATLFHNNGDGTFTDVTAQAGLTDPLWSTSAAFIDYDRDGHLDLFVAHYLDFSLASNKVCHDSVGARDYCSPRAYKPVPAKLYRNGGHGRFADVTDAAGISKAYGAGLGVTTGDYNGDGWPDLYVANDYGTEELFLNQRGERFVLAENIGLDESSKSGMSVALGDIMNDGTLGVFVTNISQRQYLFQGNNLRLNRLAQGFGLTNVSAGEVADCGWAWGSQFADLDNDGRQDLVVLNGFISGNPKREEYWYDMTKLSTAAGALAEDAASWPDQQDRGLSGYERSRLLLNQSVNTPEKRQTKFVDVALEAGLDDLLDGRAVAMADFFHKGKLDLVVANQQGPLLFYENRVDPARHWIQFELEGTRSNRAAVGAQVTLFFGGVRTVQAVLAGSGFCSQNEFPLHYGLGALASVEKAVIRWPNGAEQTLEAPAIDQRHHVKEP